jgi:signal transduction histidine kinase
MAGTLSACPREESAFRNEASAGRAAAVFVLAKAPAVRLLQGVVVVHGAGLLFALVHPVSLPSLVVLVSGFAVTLVALGMVQSHASVGSQDLSPPLAGSGASPSPLPFVGERITLEPDRLELTSLARAAARLSRLSSGRPHPWGELMARVSHELRTPLNAVIGFSDVMQSELLGPVGHPRYREYARHIGDCGRDLLKSAEDTLAITCLLDHDPNVPVATGVDLRLMVEDAWTFHSGPSSSHGLTLDAEIPEDIEIMVERRPMRQILINLFAEAVRRSDSRGHLGVVATVNGDLVQIEVFLRGQPGAPSVGQASLPICLARALLELNGASLIEVDDPHSTWRAVTVLTRDAQRDFFAALPEAVPLPVSAPPFREAVCA